MKRRAPGETPPAAAGGGGCGGGGGGGFSKGKGKGSSWKWRKGQRLAGGGALSLEAFANAKSQNPCYNPAVIKKQKEFYRNAKFVKKYKKSLKQQNQSGNHRRVPIPEEGGDDTRDEPKPSSKRKKRTPQSLKQEYEKKRAEDDQAKRERDATIQARREERERSEAKRKDLREKMFKKTRSGQPVMKYRIQHLLEAALESSSK